MTSFGIKNSLPTINNKRNDNNCENWRREKKYTFKIQGQWYHRMSSLRPPAQQKQHFLQIFFIISAEEQVVQRCKINRYADVAIVAELKDMLQATHPYVKIFKNAIEVLDATPEFKLTIKAANRWDSSAI